MTRFLLVCAGGAFGTGARYLLSIAVAAKAGERFAWGTLAVNVLGSFAMGFLAQFAASREMNDTTRLVLATGVLGGFTTYSAFNQETLRLVQSGAHGAALANVAVTLVACLAAGFGGLAAARATG